MKKTLNYRYKMAVLLMGLVAVVLTSVLLGTVDISVTECLRIVFGHIPGLDRLLHLDGIEPAHITIIMGLRLPRILLALIAGVGLATAGGVYQGIFSNPMADPYLLGVSSGAAFGATLAMLFEIKNPWLNVSSISICAFLGAMGVLFFVFSVSKVKGRLPVMTMILSGVAMNYLLSSLIALLMLFNSKKIERVYFWTLGSFKDAKWMEIGYLSLVVAGGVLLIYRFTLELNVMMLHRDEAKTLGVNTEQTKRILLLISSVMVAALVSTCGIIGFVGLMIPHAARVIVGPDHRKLLPFTAVLGGIFMVFSDTLARSILQNAEISVGIITAVFGVPFFLLLLSRNKQTYV